MINPNIILVIIVGWLIFAVFVGFGINQQANDCAKKGGTAVNTNDGLTCFSNVINN